MRSINESKLISTLNFIKEYQLSKGKSPSYREIARNVCFPSISSVQRYVKCLQDKGLIKQNNLGSIILPNKLATGTTIVAPLVGKVACGQPILAEENIEEMYRLPTAIFGKEKVMILRAQGDSMIDVGINNGDLIVARLTNFAEEGQIVVALIDDSATVKRFFKRNGKVVLHPENPNYKDIVVDNVVIQGVVKQVIHNF